MTTILGTKKDLGYEIQIEKKNPLVFERHIFIGTAITSPLVILSLYSLGQTGDTLSRIFFVFLAPLLVYLTFLSLVISFGYDFFVKDPNIKKLISFLLIGSMASTMMAVSLNSRGIYVAILGYASLTRDTNPESLTLVAIAVMVPIIEETLKAFPLLLVMRGYIISWGGHEKRIISNYQTALLFATLSGGMFTMLETYNYILAGSDFLDIAYDEIWRTIYLQVLIRSTSPLHYFTTNFIGIGIFLTLYFTRSRRLLFRDYMFFFASYFVAIVLHGTWNGMATYYSRRTDETALIFGVLPIQNFVFGILALVGLLAIIFFGSRINDSTCEFCGNLHAPPYDAPSHYEELDFNPLPSLNTLRWKRSWRCRVCKSPKEVGTTCEKCGSSMIFTCGHCGRPIPVYSTSCWNCNYSLPPPYARVFEYRDSFMDKFSIGVTMTFAGVYITTVLSQLFLYMFSTSSAPANQILLFSVMSLSYIWTVKWALSPDDSSLGILLSRLLTGLTLIQIVFLFQILTFILTFGNVFKLIAPTFVNFLMIVFAIQIILKYEPVFKGGTS